MRPTLLRDLLVALQRQSVSRSFEVVVIDNDANRTAEFIVDEVRGGFAKRHIALTYGVEPDKNIATARNTSIATAHGEWIAFIDDDETPDTTWIEVLARTAEEHDAAGVFGRVIPEFDSEFPEWQHDSDAFGGAIPLGLTVRHMRTSNALVRRSVLMLRPGPFDPAIGRNGGSDSELFAHLHALGNKFVIAPDAIVREHVPLERSRLRWHFRRDFRSGWNFSDRRARHHGVLKGGVLVVVSLVPRLAVIAGRGLLMLPRMRLAALSVFKGLADILGRIGFFVGLRVEEYN